MLSERMLSKVVEACTANYLQLKPCDEAFMPSPNPGQPYMLYMHVPFCERLCPYCSFNRFPFSEGKAHKYFANLRKEMMMLRDMGYERVELMDTTDGSFMTPKEAKRLMLRGST